VEAQEMAQTISATNERVKALSDIAAALTKTKEYQQVIDLIQGLWCSATNRDNMLQLARLALSLIVHQPILGTGMADGITWVDDFLKQA
jgi:hypothetical protein